MCLAQFASHYKYAQKIPQKTVFQENGGSDLLSLTKVFNQNIYLPRYIILNEGLGYMRLRFHPAVMRIHSTKKKEGSEQHYAELQLYTHWRKEFDKDTCVEMHGKNKDQINANKKLIYPWEDPMDLFDQEEWEMIRPTHLIDMIDSQGEQENNDDLVEGTIENPDNFHYAGDFDSTDRPIFDDAKYKQIKLPKDTEIDRLTTSLVPEQMDVLRLVVSACKDVVKLRDRALEKPKQV